MRDARPTPDAEDRAPVLWISHKPGERCGQCAAELHPGVLVEVKRGSGVRCAACAGFGDLELLPAGDAALTRRAVKLSARHAVVVKFSRARGRAERQGVLVEKEALAAAERECAADAERRAVAGERRAVRLVAEDAEYRERFRARILELFPRCPPDAAKQIADHACRKHSGRVGRTQMAKDLAERAIELAVRAHVRHEHTRYDEVLLETDDREGAREDVRDAVAEVLARWRG